MTTFVLVHGAWHGGWCWKPVLPLLRAAGHEVHAPTLTGLGERRHLLTRSTGLATHVQDVCALAEMEEVRDAVLVGHSYGGMVIAGVADRMPERVRRLVYLDAFAPADGDSILGGVPEAQRAAMLEQCEREGAGWLVPAPPLSVWGVTDPRHLAWIAPRTDAQPLKTLTDRAHLTNPARLAIPKTYASCTKDQRAAFQAIAARVRAEPGWDYRELDEPHDVMATAPEKLASLLLSLA